MRIQIITGLETCFISSHLVEPYDKALRVISLMSKKKSLPVYVRDDVRKFLEDRCKDRKYPYKNPSDYLEAMVLLDRAGGVPHQYLWEIVSRPEFARAELLAELRQKIEECKKKNADSW